MGQCKGNIHSQGGWTLVELLLVCIIIVIVAGLAFMQRGAANEKLQRLNVARELKVAFERARFDSVKRRANPQASVTVTPTSFTLRTYKDVSGTAVASDQTTSLPAGIVIERYDGTALTSLVVNYNMRGETPASPAPQFFVCNSPCPSSGDTDATKNARSNIVLVTQTGTVNMLSGSSSLPTFGVPTMTNLTATNSINNDVVLP